MSDYVTLSPEDVAKTLGTSPWWVREQARRGRIPHLRVGRGSIRLLPEHVDALLALITVECVADEANPPVTASSDLSALGSTVKSLAAHRRRPHVSGDRRLS
ncbi:helix-turn-helix domain-containing protein [Cellulomonas sp. ATA003]|uniref:helix-turn-helix domain-containing protein n=1 Tax=Cellulomonas sp. ATA003 TaxID=3073064 RepID=UPI0037BF66B6